MGGCWVSRFIIIAIHLPLHHSTSMKFSKRSNLMAFYATLFKEICNLCCYLLPSYTYLRLLFFFLYFKLFKLYYVCLGILPMFLCFLMYFVLFFSLFFFAQHNQTRKPLMLKVKHYCL